MGTSFYIDNPDIIQTQDLETLLEDAFGRIEGVQGALDQVTGVVTEVTSLKNVASASALNASNAATQAATAVINAQAIATKLAQDVAAGNFKGEPGIQGPPGPTTVDGLTDASTTGRAVVKGTPAQARTALGVDTELAKKVDGSLASQDEAQAGNSVAVPSVLRVRQMFEQFGTVEFGRFGSVKDMDTDSAADANKRAMDDAVSFLSATTRNGGSLRIPEGDFYFSGIQGNGQPGKTSRVLTGSRFSIRAAGRKSCRLIADANRGSTGILDLYSTDPNTVYDVEGFSVLARGAVPGKGLSLRMDYHGDVHESTAIVHNVRVAPLVRATDYFRDGGIDLSGNWQPIFDKVMVNSAFPVGAIDFSDNAIQFKQAFGINVSNCYGPLGSNFLINGCSTGLLHDCDADVQFEGGAFNNFRVQAQKTSIFWRRTNIRGAELFFGYGHVNGRDDTIVVDGAKSVDFGRVLFYKDGCKSSTANNPGDVRLKNVERVDFGRSEFYGLSIDPTQKVVDAATNVGRANIIIDASGPPSATQYAQDIAIHGARFGAYALAGIIVVGTNAQRIVVKDAIFSPGSCAKRYIDDSNVIITSGVTKDDITPLGTYDESLNASTATDGPIKYLHRFRATAGRMGATYFTGVNSAGAEVIFARDGVSSSSHTAGSHTAERQFQVAAAGALLDALTLAAPLSNGDTAAFLAFKHPATGALKFQRVYINSTTGALSVLLT